MSRRKPSVVSPNLKPRLLKLLLRLFPSAAPLPPEIEQAHSLIAAIDAGGVPLYPGRVNQIARNLGLEVSGKAPVEETIERIRAAVARYG